MPKEPPTSRQWRKTHKSISWQAAGTDSLKATIVSVTEAGGALMFSRTMDGGALVLSVYNGDDRTKEYVTEQGDIPQLLAWVLETYG